MQHVLVAKNNLATAF